MQHREFELGKYSTTNTDFFGEILRTNIPKQRVIYDSYSKGAYNYSTSGDHEGLSLVVRSRRVNAKKIMGHYEVNI